MRTCLAPCEYNCRPTPARPACELISRALQERRGLGCPLTNRKIPLQTRRTMHKEPPLDNPAPQCVAQKAAPPPSCVRFCFRGGWKKKNGQKNKKRTASPPPNPHLSASSIRGCARKTGRKTIEANVEEGGGWWPGYLCALTQPCHPSSSGPMSPFFCPPMAAEDMQTRGLGTLSQRRGGAPRPA